jgi:glycosyltransferase involved in cell wall biosynthesis
MPPFISIIVPCYNEHATIPLLLDALLAQTYPRAQMEVVIADAVSQDGTREVIKAFCKSHPDLAIRIVDNERRTIPSGLNTAIAAAKGDILIRLDAHSIPIPEYVKRCVDDIEDGRGDVVGGLWTIRPGGPGVIADAIAAAAAHPLGVGDAMYRLRASPGAVDTVPFGSFRRELVISTGAFDETLLTNEDYEFNTRVRQRGGVVWLDPQIRSTYIARASLFTLASQYWRYGYWKFHMLRRHPGSVRWRQALPPIFVTGVIAAALASILIRPARFILIAEFIAYLFVLAVAGIVLAIRQRRPLLAVGLILAIATMHFAWGSGFLWSIASTVSQKHG